MPTDESELADEVPEHSDVEGETLCVVGVDAGNAVNPSTVPPTSQEFTSSQQHTGLSV